LDLSQTRSNLYVANAGAGTLNVNNGAQVHVSLGPGIFGSVSSVGHHAGSVGEVTVTGTGSAWLNEGELVVGRSGDGTLMITNGGVVRSNYGNIGWNDGTSSVNGNGSVTVDGTNSSWSIVSSGAPGDAGRLVIGQTGNGALNITGGGSVSSVTGYIGLEFGSMGEVTVDGAGSTWGITGDLHVGGWEFPLLHGGSGMFHVTGGGRVSDIYGFIGSSVFSTGAAIVDGAGSVWTNINSLTMGIIGPASLTVSNGGTVQAINGLIVGTLGEVHGNGSITANVQNGGLVSPGNSPGVLTITGNYTQSTAGKLLIELAGTAPGAQYDQLLITGSAALDGALQVSLLSGFAPSSGSSFDILTATGGITGTFSNQQLPMLAGGLVWNLSYGPNDVILSVGGVLGDYNHNGIVDAADYILWRKTLGQFGAGLAADGNNNGTIDTGDFNIWRAHFGQTAGSGAGTIANAAIPEPTSLLQIILMAAILSTRQHRGASRVPKLVNA
jgi:T5SS/PEP-CTERM-associated repeat protein